MHTDCRIDPLYDPSTDTTCGYVVPNLQNLGHIAPPVPGDVMKRLFFPRTFTKLHGEKEGAITLKQGQQPPNPFDDSDDYDDPYEHLAPPHDPWPMGKTPRREQLERMKSQITDSLLHGEKETLLSPPIAERSSKKSKEQKSGNAPKPTPRRDGLKPPRLDSYDPRESGFVYFCRAVTHLLDISQNQLSPSQFPSVIVATIPDTSGAVYGERGTNYMSSARCE